MKIKILTSCAGLNFSFTAGETLDTNGVVAKDLIRAGYAEEVKADGKSNHPAGSRAGKHR